MKRFLLTVLTVGVFLTGRAQSDGYVHYTPIPIYTPPPSNYQFPQSYLPELPPQAYSRSQPKLSVTSEFLIYSAKINGQDYTQHYVNTKASIAFYSYSDNPNASYFAVIMPGDNSSSTGPISVVTNREAPQTATEYGMTTTTFAWDFTNHPDGSKGTASVTLIKQYRPQGTAFICEVKASNGIIIEFMGLMIH